MHTYYYYENKTNYDLEALLSAAESVGMFVCKLESCWETVRQYDI